MKQQDYKNGITHYTNALKVLEEPLTYGNRAMANLKLDQYEEAIQDANNAIRIDPSYLKAYHRRGSAYLKLNQFQNAISDFQYILEQEPNTLDVKQYLESAKL